ncbi:MAG: ABC transporter permease [Dehalococcoidales bacterium]|nr:ABC transporter permease [Dehalococcoidales bacterium]
MKLYQLVFKDVLRRKKRVLYAALGIVIAAMTVVGILTIANAGQQKIYAQLEKYGANLNILPAISNVDAALGNLNMGSLAVGDNYIQESVLPQVRQIADSMIRETLDIKDPGNIATIAPKLYVNTKVNGTSLLAVGIDPKEERSIKTWWEISKGKWLEKPDDAVIGSQVAQLLHLDVGDKIVLNNTEITVAGILDDTGSGDDYQVFVPLPTLQAAFGKEGVISSIDVRALCNGCPVENIAAGINNIIPGVRALAVKQVAATEMGMVDKMSKFMLALAGITLLIGAFGVVNTMMTSVHERIKDIGIMRAVGASRNQIIKVFIYEAVLIGIIGGLLGYMAGTLIAWGTAPLVFEGAAVTLEPWYLPLSLLMSIIVAIASAAYPAYRATTIKVSDSFRAL